MGLAITFFNEQPFKIEAAITILLTVPYLLLTFNAVITANRKSSPGSQKM